MARFNSHLFSVVDRCSLRKKCPYTESFWSTFSCIQTEYGEVRSISLYSVWMREIAVQNNSEYGYFSHSGYHKSILKTVKRRLGTTYHSLLAHFFFNNLRDIFIVLFSRLDSFFYFFFTIVSSAWDTFVAVATNVGFEVDCFCLNNFAHFKLHP